ncbi:amidase domain-containing protein [Bacillus sp. AK128]
MRSILEDHVSTRIHENVGRKGSRSPVIEDELKLRYQGLRNRKAVIVKSQAVCQILEINERDNGLDVRYSVQLKDLIKQGNQFFNEELMEERRALIVDEQVVQDQLIQPIEEAETFDENDLIYEDSSREPFVYDRREAVRYAEQWWDSYNPKYEKFEVDCTNYISQCLHAGGAPMTGYPNRGKGWWMRDGSWSYSWSVANALRRYLPNAKSGLRAVEKDSASELVIGDVICYDFEGDGKWNHNTIVVAKDSDNMPLVNAHTYNSRMRYWEYTDSTAYTPNIKYAFLHIIDDQ